MAFLAIPAALLFCFLPTGVGRESSWWYPNTTLHVTGSDKPIPMLGFGTCCRVAALGEPLVRSIKSYLSFGGRHIDTAWLYGNHRDVGRAIRESKVPREELWITSKILMGFGDAQFDTNHAGEPMKKAESVEEAMYQLSSSLEQLGLEYLDLMLMHAPAHPSELNVKIWQALIEAQRQGKVRNIGVSQHGIDDIETLHEETGVLPSVNQISYHPWMQKSQTALVKWCQKKGIVITAFNSLKGSQGHHAELVKRAKNASLPPTKWLLQWALKQNVVIIPGATSAEHIKSNLMLSDGGSGTGVSEL